MLIFICMVWSIVFQTCTTYAMTEGETYITDGISVDSETETNEETSNEILESVSYEPVVTYSSTPDVVTYGEYDYVINTDEMESFYSGDFEYVINSDGVTATIVSYNGNERDDLIFPKKIDGYTVTVIGDGKNSVCSMWFSGSVVIPYGVTVINNNAFLQCQSLKGSLVIPNSVTYIGLQAFSICRKLTGPLVIPNSVTYIGRSAFLDCCGLTGSLVIPDSISSIERSTFCGCTGLTGSPKIPDSVTSIGDHAFRDCTGFTGSLEIPDSVTSIGDHAFRDCTGFTGSLEIPDSVTSIGDYAFKGCSGFTGTLVIPDSVTSIGEYAFVSCTGFKGPLVIPDSVLSIGAHAFEGLTVFNSLEIGAAVKSIGDSAFSGCSNFSGALKIPDSVISIGSYAFSYCKNFTSLEIGTGVKTIEDSAFYKCSKLSGALNIPDNVTTIGECAFSGCSGFTSLVLSKNLESIEYYTFGGCSGFKGSLVIPNSIEYIDMCAFYGCTGFTGTLVMPATYIGEDSFFDCNGFESLVITDGDFTTHTALFDFLYNLNVCCAESVTNVLLAESLVTLPEDMFYYYEKLQSIYFNGDVPTSWGANSVSDNVVIYYPEGNTSGWTSPTWTAPDGTVYNTKTYKIDSTWDTTAVTLDEGETYSFGGEIYTAAENGFANIEVKITSATDESVGITYYSKTDIGACFYDLSVIPLLKENARLSDGNQTIILAPGTTWNIRLSATDADGNTLGDSEILTLTVAGKAIEQGPPTVRGLSNKYTIKLGESFTLEGVISAFGEGLLDKVILKHSKAGTTFENLVLNVNLSSATENLSEFTISGDTYPLNTLGTHMFKIYATANNFTDSSKVIGSFYITVEHDCDWVYSESVEGSGVWSKVDDDFHKQVSKKAEYKCSVCGKTKVETVSVESELEPHDLSIEKITGTTYEVLEETHEDYMIKHKIIQSKARECEAKGCDHEISDESDFVYEFHDIEDGVCKYCGFILSSDEKVRVTFNLNGGVGTFATVQEVIVGNVVKEPEEPTKSGYVFMGWYSNPECSGYAWFSSIMNNGKGMPVSSDLTLYAKWEDSQNIVYGRDTFSFVNTYSDFLDDYTITGDYYDILMEGLYSWEKSWVKQLMNSDWGGSCFGMAAVLSLIRAGKLDVDFFQTKAKNTFDLEAPSENNTINNLINYYFLMQITNRTNAFRSNCDGVVETLNNASIITALNESSYPVVVGFDILNKNGVRIGGHAVVAYGYEETDLNYNVSIWDPNDRKTPNTLVISKDFSTSYFVTTYDTSVVSSYVKYALTVESEAYDYKNLQEELENLGYSGGAGATSLMSMGVSDETRNLILTTNYNSFSISSSDGKSAVIEYGRKISGDLDIGNGDCLNYYENELEISFSITDSSDVSYTVTPVLCNSVVTNEPLAEYSTLLIYNDEEDGFYSLINAEAPGTLTFESDGTVSTQFDESVKQNITVVPSNANSSLYETSVELTDSSVNISVNGSDTLISCTPGTEINVSTENDYNKIVFDSYTIEDSGSVSLSESSESDGICTLGHLEESIGSSVIFYSMGGSPIESQTNITSGDTAVQPDNPTRAGFMFGGWYTDSSCSEGFEWDFNTPITEDVRVYAKWHVDCNYTHKVTFKIEGMDDIVCIAYEGATLEAKQIPEIPEKEGYTAKWDVSDFTNITKDIVVNAVYTLIVEEYTIDYNLNGGDEGQSISSQTKSYDVDLTLTEQKFTRKGYDFKGWSTSQNGEVEYLSGAIYSENKSVTMYAVWAIHSHSWDEGVVTKESTHTEYGERTYTCQGCSETRKVPINKTAEHTYGEWSEIDDAIHMRSCECGASEYEDHNWDEGVVTIEPTHTTPGEKTCTCMGCGATTTQSVPELTEHVYKPSSNYTELVHIQICICGDEKTSEHDWNDGVVTKEATHTEYGEIIYTCKDCPIIKIETLDKDKNHSYGEWICVDSELHKRVCYCGDVETVNHNWDDGVITVKPTHSESGEKTYKCNNCSGTKTEIIDKVEEHTYSNWIYVDNDIHKKICICGDVKTENHNWGEGTVTKEPTHTEYGWKSYVCDGCETSRSVRMDKISEHTYGQWISVDKNSHKRICECGDEEVSSHEWGENEITSQPTHTEYGECVHVCNNCSFVWKETLDKIPEHSYSEWFRWDDYFHRKTCECGDVKSAAHDWDNGTVVYEPTHTEEGMIVYNCPKCSATKLDLIPKTPEHSYTEWMKIDDAYHQGLCICGESSEPRKHSGGTATCTTKAICNLCGETYGNFAKHSYTHFDLVDSTCTETGIQEHYYCNVCDKYFDINKNEVSKDSLVIAAKNHQGGVATCVSRAVCEICGLHYGEVADVHNNKVFIPETSSTCISWGYKSHYKCLDCGQLFNTDMVTKATSDEIFSMEYGDHYDGDWVESDSRICDLCGEEFTIPLTEISLDHSAISMKTLSYFHFVIERFPHNATSQLFWKSSDTSVATVTSWGQVYAKDIGTAVITVSDRTGTVSASCVVTVTCSHSSKMGYREEPSTCETLGHKAYWECMLCGQLLKADMETETTLEEEMYTEYAPHKGGKATCTSKANCTYCGKLYGELSNHNYRYWVSLKATCTGNGIQEHYRCNSCGSYFDMNKNMVARDVLVIAATGHRGGTATCSSKAICTVCDVSYGGFAEHIYDNSIYQYDESKHWHKCLNCDYHKDIHVHIPGPEATTDTPQICTECGYVIAEIVISYGDVSNDGIINLDDVVTLLRHVSKAAELTDHAVLAASDVTKDGKINLDDVVKLLRYVSKAIPDLE